MVVCDAANNQPYFKQQPCLVVDGNGCDNGAELCK